MKRSVTVAIDDGEEVLILRRIQLSGEPLQPVAKQEPPPPVTVAPHSCSSPPIPRALVQGAGLAPYVTVPLAAEATGLSEKAIRRKIEDGKWLDGREYRRSPDGGIFISMKGYAQWVENGG